MRGQEMRKGGIVTNWDSDGDPAVGILVGSLAWLALWAAWMGISNWIAWAFG